MTLDEYAKTTREINSTYRRRLEQADALILQAEQIRRRAWQRASDATAAATGSYIEGSDEIPQG